MALIDTSKIADQFGDQTKQIIEKIAAEGLGATANVIMAMETRELIITISLRDKVV